MNVGEEPNANMSGGSIDLTSCVSSWPRNCLPLTGSVLLVSRLRQFDGGACDSMIRKFFLLSLIHV